MAALLAGLGLLAITAPADVFTIRAVDEQTGRGVPLVELRTTGEIRYVTDSGGCVAFDEPGLLGRQVWFHVSSPGYEARQDGFGYRGIRFETKPGGEGVVRLRRINLAERLYRVIGAGIYRDSVRCGQPLPIREPLLNAGVVGSDSVQTAVYHGRLFWLWGDTNHVNYPLGNFHVPAATSLLPGASGLDPGTGVDLTYFVDEKGVAKPTCRMEGDGPTWAFGLAPLKDAAGREQLLTGYVKPDKSMKPTRRGIARWNDEREVFEHVVDIPLDAPLRPDGNAVEADGYVYFCSPYPLVRVPATAEAYRDLSRYEGYTCFQPGTREIDRDEQGRVRYAWRAGTAAVNSGEQPKLEKDGKLQQGEGLLQLRDIETGAAVQAHGGDARPNAFRDRWVLIAVQSFGKVSFLGEVWYAEADGPEGPWVYARKIATHPKMDFYNPLHHPYFDQDDGRLIYFEGTYVNTFAGNPMTVPRYNYNQLMYRLDLGDERLVLPVAVYRQADGGLAFRSGESIAFFACDRPAPGLVRVGEFWALPVGDERPGTVLLYRDGDGYGLAAKGEPVARVWADPRARNRP